MIGTVAMVLMRHRFREEDHSCSCEDIWYDYRRTVKESLVEHGLHLEKVLWDVGFTNPELAKAWADGYKACNMEWEQCWDLVTPDEDRFSAVNPFLNKQQTL